MTTFEEFFKATKTALQSTQATYRFTKPIEDIARSCWETSANLQKEKCDELFKVKDEIIRRLRRELEAK